jgi:hypothetical protein
MNNLELLKVYQFDKKIRCGDNQDGGYVFGELQGTYDCYISCGVANHESFSRDFINLYNMTKENSFAFDGTINNYPYEYTENISFIQKNIDGNDNDKNSNLFFLIHKYKDIFMKMDIEGGEYNWLLKVNEDQLKKFKQMVIEFHGITQDGWGHPYETKIKCLEKLQKTHYIIHAHGNNNSKVMKNIPDVIELSFIRKDYFQTVPSLNTQLLPCHLDFPNDLRKKDIDLVLYPFVSNVKTILIGVSDSNTKIIDFHEPNRSYRFHLAKNPWPDCFEFTVQDSKLIIKRLDNPCGWGYNHSVIIQW